MPDSNEKYLNLITSEYSNKPLFKAYVKSFLDLISPSVDNLNNFINLFNLDNAVGDQLDKIGQVVGISRVLPIDDLGEESILQDDLYRTVIKAKIAKNHWNGSYESLIDIVKIVFPEATIQIDDNQDMTCYVNIYIDVEDPDIYLTLLQNNILFPKPSGVQIVYTIFNRPFFGFDEDTENDPPEWLGWGLGMWATN